MPFELANIEAADRLWNQLDELRRSDRALAALQGSLPGFDPESTLLKVLALHPIDTSKTHVGLPLARDLCGLLARVDPHSCGSELVDALALVADRHGKSSYEGLGFASRFAHHFVDNERYPVLDAWSERALQHLLGGELTGAPGESRYGLFARNFTFVATRLGLIRRRRLGRWLWLSGQHAAWTANARTPINRAVRELFERGLPELSALVPDDAGGPVRGQPRAAVEPPPALPRAPRTPASPTPAYDPRRRPGTPRS